MAFDILDWLIMKVVIWICLIALIAIIIGLPFFIYGFYIQSTSPIFSLYKNQWNCTQSKNVTTTTYNLVGKVMVPITSTHEECIQYTKVK